MPNLFYIRWQEDSTPTVLGRITAPNGTGAATGVDGEGNWLKQADISTITCKVFDLSSAAPNTPVAEPTVDKTVAVLDTPVTTNVVWTEDTVGYNFTHQLLNTIFATGEHTYRVEYKVTLTGGAVFHGAYEGPADPLRGS